MHIGLRVLLGVWVIFSGIYMVRDLWQHFETDQLSKARVEGREAALREIIAAGSQCKPFTIELENKRAELANVECLRRATAQQPAPPMPGVPPTPAPGLATGH